MSAQSGERIAELGDTASSQMSIDITTDSATNPAVFTPESSGAAPAEGDGAVDAESASGMSSAGSFGYGGLSREVSEIPMDQPDADAENEKKKKKKKKRVGGIAFAEMIVTEQ
eukprot:3579263-Rhodomonas_salina.1